MHIYKYFKKDYVNYMEENQSINNKILVVEDNETYRKVIVNALRIAKVNVLEAENGLRGLEIIRAEKPNLAIIDIYMPVMDGLSMLAEIKKDQQLMYIPVVMLTNVQEELDNAVKNGAEEAVLKASVTPQQVVEVCLKYLNKTVENNNSLSASN